MINTANEYQAAARRTTRPQNEEHRRHVLTDGTIGEMCELLVEQNRNSPADVVMKELGDVWWYVAYAADTLHIDLDQLIAVAGIGYASFMEIVAAMGSLAEHNKKVYAHGKAFDKATVELALITIIRGLNGIAAAYKLDMVDVWRENIRKLWIRYPQGFNEAASEARVDVEQAHEA